MRRQIAVIASAAAALLCSAPAARALGLAPVDLVPPAISGSAQQGQLLTCSSGTWLNGATSYAYSWLRNGTAISGATGSSYMVTAADVSQLISCAVLASNDSGPSAAPAVSLPVTPTAATGTGGSGTGGSGSGGSGSGSSSGSAGGTGGSSSGSAGGTGGSSTGAGGNRGSGGSSSGRVSGGGANRLPKPRVLSFTVTPRRMVIQLRGARRRTSGVEFSYRLDRSASVLVVIEHEVGKGKSKHWKVVAKLARARAKSLRARIKWAGRDGRALVPAGRFRALIAAADAGGWSAARSVGFLVARRRLAPRAHR